MVLFVQHPGIIDGIGQRFEEQRYRVTLFVVRLVRGSHKGPHYSHPMALSGASMDLEEEGGPLPDVDADPGRYPVVCYELNPGDAVLFHPAMLHSTRGGECDEARISYSFRMMGDASSRVKR